MKVDAIKLQLIGEAIFQQMSEIERNKKKKEIPTQPDPSKLCPVIDLISNPFSML